VGSRSRQPMILGATDQTEPRNALLSGSSSGELVPGAEVASYRVLGKLGSGGMGSVYTGIHTQIERLVAIKVLHPELSTDAEAAARFLNEARVVNLIRHPNIVSVESVGQLPNGSAYMVMEYLEGQTLNSRLKWGGGRLGPVTLHFARQIASALAAAHDRGVVHCDLKPANVMVIADPEMPGGERVKVLDFGIATLLRGAAVQDIAQNTRVLGTPLYMSPEQCSGGIIDGKTDVYSLGVLLFQLVAGRPPFTSTSVLDLIDLHRSEPAPALSHLAPTVPSPLSALIASMLAKEPQRRPTMREVAEQLEALYASPVKPIPVDRRIKHRRWIVYAAMALTAVLALGSIGLFVTRSIVGSDQLLTITVLVFVFGGPALIAAWWRIRRSEAEMISGIR